jgi:hypothetical protein
VKDFYLVYVWGMGEMPERRHSTLKSAVDEAERLRGLTDHAIYIMKPEHCLEGKEPQKSLKKRQKMKQWHAKQGSIQKSLAEKVI